jgi:hypothetical protein
MINLMHVYLLLMSIDKSHKAFSLDVTMRLKKIHLNMKIYIFSIWTSWLFLNTRKL